ncbi:MAG: CoA transferase [Chloroflexi bacterium]|nr:CoA transferase [Chloroflexota bacterium]
MRGPLSGARILDLSRAIAGPYGAMILGDLGADVIKIEPPTGDVSRAVGEDIGHKGESYYYMAYNRSKKSLVLDLKTPLGKGAFYDLVRISDVVWDNFKPGVMEHLGADYETLRKMNPQIISCSITGFGSSGPYRDNPSFDVVAQAMSGVMSITGEPGGEPVRCGPPIGDLAASMFAAHGVTAALYAREKTGRGQKVDVSLLDSQLSLMTYHLSYYFCSGTVPGPLGSGHLSIFPYGAYKTKKGYIVIGPCWPRIARVLGVEEIIEDPRFKELTERLRHREELDAILQEAFLKEEAQDWLEILRAEEIPAGLINTVDKAVQDPQVLHRNMILNLKHPLGGEVRLAGNPIKTSDNPEEYLPPPTLGQNNGEILGELLGYSKAKIAQLRKEEEEHAEELNSSIFKIM